MRRSVGGGGLSFLFLPRWPTFIVRVRGVALIDGGDGFIVCCFSIQICIVLLFFLFLIECTKIEDSIFRIRPLL